MFAQSVKAHLQNEIDQPGELKLSASNCKSCRVFSVVCSSACPDVHTILDIRISLYEPEACGITGRAYTFFERLLHASFDNIVACICEDGCPQCKHILNCAILRIRSQQT